MDYNLKITFGGKTYLAEIDGNSEQIFSKEQIVESSSFTDCTDFESESSLSEGDSQWWTTNLHDLFKDAISVRIDYLDLNI